MASSQSVLSTTVRGVRKQKQAHPSMSDSVDVLTRFVCVRACVHACACARLKLQDA